MNNFKILGDHEQIRVLEEFFRKTQYIGANCLKRGAWTLL